jgi:hypothetical protein
MQYEHCQSLSLGSSIIATNSEDYQGLKYQLTSTRQFDLHGFL